MLNMQLQLQEMSIPHAIIIQKKLLSIFGTNGEGRATKELHDAWAVVAGITARMKGSATTTTTTMMTTTKTTAVTRVKKGKEKAKGKGQGKGYETLSCIPRESLNPRPNPKSPKSGL